MQRWLAIVVVLGCGKHVHVEGAVHGDQIAVIASQPGASAAQLETSVAAPLERAVGSVPHVEHLRTRIADGSVKIEIELESDADSLAASMAVQEALQPALRQLPRDLMPPLVMLEPEATGTVRYVVSSGMRSRTQVTQLADAIDRDLQSTPGVMRVDTCGAQYDEWRVDVDPQRLAAVGLTLASVVDAVRAANTSLPAGHLEAGGDTFVVRGATVDAGELPALTLAMHGEAPVRLRDVASVTLTGGPLRCRAFDNAEQVVTGAVVLRSGGDAQEIREAIDGVLAKARQKLPAGVKLAVWNPDAAEISVDVADLRALDRVRSEIGRVPSVQHVLLQLEGTAGTARVLVAPHDTADAVVRALRAAGFTVHARDEIVVAIDGLDPAKLAELANSVQTAVHAHAELVPSGTIGLLPLASVHVEPDAVAAARYDISESEIADAIRAASEDGIVASTVFTQTGQVDVVVRVPGGPQAIDQLRITSKSGTVVPLSQIAKLAQTSEPTEIRHFDHMRWVGVAASGDARTIRDIADKLALPAGYRVRLLSGAAVR